MKITTAASLFIFTMISALGNNELEELCREIQKIRLDLLYIQQLVSEVKDINQRSEHYGQNPLTLLAMSKFCNRDEQEHVTRLLVEAGAVQNQETKQFVLDLARATRNDLRNGVIKPLDELKNKQKLG